MTHTGNYSKHQEIDDNPEKPFVKDLENDLFNIDQCYNKSTATMIKKAMLQSIINSI